MAKRTINRLIAIFDEDINGHVSIEEYYNALYAYNCLGGVTKAFETDNNALSYTDSCVYKLVEHLREKNITNLELFNQIDDDGGGTIDTIEMKIALKSFEIFNEKELFCIRNYFNVDPSGEIDYDQFNDLMIKAQQVYETKQANDAKL